MMEMTTLNQAVESSKRVFDRFFTGKDAFILRRFILTMRVSGNYNKENGRLQWDKIKWKKEDADLSKYKDSMRPLIERDIAETEMILKD